MAEQRLALRWHGGAAQSLVIDPEELHGGENVVLAADAEADPPRVRQSMVRPRAAGGHEVPAHAHTHQQVGHAAHMHVADLAIAHAEFDPAEAVRCDADAGPLAQHLGDFRAVIQRGHKRPGRVWTDISTAATWQSMHRIPSHSKKSAWAVTMPRGIVPLVRSSTIVRVARG